MKEERGRPRKSWLTGANRAGNLSHLAGSGGTSLNHLQQLASWFLLCSLSPFPFFLSRPIFHILLEQYHHPVQEFRIYYQGPSQSVAVINVEAED